MFLTRSELRIAVFSGVYITAFTVFALGRKNYEFVMYAGIVNAVFILILAKQRAVRLDSVILWGLSLWGLLHMAGGNLRVGDGVLYSVQLVPRVLRFDQLVHLFGFGVATLVCHHLLRPVLNERAAASRALPFLIVMMGCGVGALNEIIEFIAVLIMPETGVGGYENTLWDMVFNLLGAVAAVSVLKLRGALSAPSKQ